MIVAAAQFAPVHGDVPANLRLISDLLERAAARGAELVVFPELATTGYAWASAGQIAPLAESVPGPVTEWLAGQCRRHGCHVVLGLAERGGLPYPLYNTAVLVGPDGLAGRYRKVNLWSWDTLWAAAGTEPPAAWPTPHGRIGILICADLDYPEGTSWLARAGADIVAAPVCWSGEPAPSPVWRTRARDACTPFIVANVSGTEWGETFAGGSCVIGEAGNPLGRVPNPQGLAVAAVDLPAARRLRHRRAAKIAGTAPSAFEALDRNTHLFPPSHFLRPGTVSRAAASVSVAVVQGPAEGDPEDVLTSLAALARLGEPGERPVLVVLPTLVPATPADPGLPERLALACRRYSPAEFVLSVLDERTGRTSVLFAADGAVVTSFQVSAAGERTGDGASLRPVSRSWGTLGLLAAAELLRPEPARCLAVNGADLIAATGRLADLPPFDLWRVRAGENNCYLAVANATLPGGHGGRSAVYGPYYYDRRPPCVALDSVEQRATALSLTLDPATPAGRMLADKPTLAQRRPELYRRSDGRPA